MNFYNSADDNSGITLVNNVNSDYSVIWNSVNASGAQGGTPLAHALDLAKTTLDASKAADTSKDCRLKAVILITDGQDTFACGGTGSDFQDDHYKRRKLVVQKAKALADAGYKVFVIGFGKQMPQAQINTLNWAAYFGGTDNTLEDNNGNPYAITISTSTPVSTVDYCTGGDDNDPGTHALSGYAYYTTSETDLIRDLQDAVNTIKTN